MGTWNFIEYEEKEIWGKCQWDNNPEWRLSNNKHLVCHAVIIDEQVPSLFKFICKRHTEHGLSAELFLQFKIHVLTSVGISCISSWAYFPNKQVIQLGKTNTIPCSYLQSQCQEYQDVVWAKQVLKYLLA